VRTVPPGHPDGVGMRKYAFVLSVAAVVVVLDQVTKWYIRRTIGLHESIVVLDSFFHITYVRNAGGAFSLFAGAPRALRLPFFILVAIIAVVALLAFVRRVEPGRRLLLFGLGAILGGAMGNLADRMRSGEVTDFLDFHWHGWYWPAFNVADSFISTGMVILLLYSFFWSDERDRSPSAPR
jgi:signal peptidase II